MSADSTIPQPRVIVLCFDGTANQYSAQVSHLLCRLPLRATGLTCNNTRTQMSSSFTVFSTSLVLSTKLFTTRFVFRLSECIGCFRFSIEPVGRSPLTSTLQPGVGTYFNPGVVSPALTWIAKILDQAIAWWVVPATISQNPTLRFDWRQVS